MIKEILMIILTYIELNKYLKALSILLIVVILIKLFLFILKKIIKKIIKRTKTEIDDILIEKLEKPIILILSLIGLKIIIKSLEFNEKADIYLKHGINSILILIGTYILILIINILLDLWGKRFAKKTESRLDDELLPMVHKFVKITLFILAFIVILQEWSINITPMLASLGIAGIAIGFAVKDYLANIVGGIALILDKNFKVGDYIVAEGETGQIQEIGLRTTRIKTFDNELITIPNGVLSNTKIQNYMQPDLKVRVVISFNVAYGASHKKVKDIALSILKEIPESLKEPTPSVSFIEMGDFSLHFKLYFWVKDPDERMKVKDKANCLLYDALNNAKIEIPYPTHVVYIKK
ncbi:mechanosensitive ion channel family protein [Candidatus Woesearchaeota archaeon]|nr:mechanosensitive ion channel family protein [Candidatus Woesearchaeota archaeon]